MKVILTAAIAALVVLCAIPAAALSEIGGDPRIFQSLICDTPDQVVRFVELDGPADTAAAISAVNREAGSERACIVASYLAQRQAVVVRVSHQGQVYGVVRMRAFALRTLLGWQVGEPVTWFSIEKLPESDL